MYLFKNKIKNIGIGNIYVENVTEKKKKIR